MRKEHSNFRLTALTAIVVCFCLSTLVSSFQRDIFLASKTIQTLSAPDFRLCKDQQKFLRNVEEEKQTRWLFHLRGPITEEKKRITENLLGVKLGGYIPQNTFVVLATREQAEKARETPHVLWVGAYLPEYKLSPELRTLAEELGTDKKSFSQTSLNFFHDEYEIPEAHSQTLSQWTRDLSSVSTVSLKRLSKTSTLLQLKQAINIEALDLLVQKLSKIHEVTWIEPISVVEPSTKWSVRFEQSANPNFDEVPSLYVTRGITGKSQTVALVDSGIDASNCFFSNLAIKCENNGGGCSTNTAHGTAMGSVIFGNSSTLPAFNGHAPDANAIVYSIPAQGNDGTEGTVNFFLALYQRVFQAASSAGARVFVAGYAGGSKLYDNYASNVDNNAYNNPQVLTILPAGNNGAAGPSSIGSPGLSKNALVVGSTQNAIEALRSDISKVPEAGRANVQDAKYTALFGKDSLSSFSSRGPTTDLRFKPDVVFPGEVIYTATPGACSTSATSGTSIAAAGAAGAALLIRDYLSQGYYPEGARSSGNSINPTSAQLKALLIASSTEVSVVDEIGPLGALQKVKYFETSPQGAFGFGRIQLSNILHFNSTGTKKFFIDQNTTRSVGTGQSHTYCFPTEAGARVKVTLVWNDPLSTQGTSFALVNNLDLVVVQTSNGREFRANGLEVYDNTNNVEVVSFIAPEKDTYMVTVTGTSVPAQSPQIFSVVISGDIELQDFNAAACPTALTTLKCPNLCSNNGVCEGGICQCKAGFSGPDCSITLCKFNCRGTSDESVVTSSNGICDLLTGKCVCDSLHTGEYCQTFVQVTTQTIETGFSKQKTILAVILCCVGGLCLGLLLGFLISKVFMEKQRKKRREELLKGNQKF